MKDAKEILDLWISSLSERNDRYVKYDREMLIWFLELLDQQVSTYFPPKKEV